MPIVTSKPQLPSVPQPNTQATPPNYKGIVEDTLIKPVESLLSYISGYPWTVTYYRQLLGEHNNVRELDVGSPDLYQTYERIHDFEIRVQTPLNASFDSETGITTYVGSAVLYAVIIPNTFDYFIADAGQNRHGIFKVTNVERNSVRSNTAWTLEYLFIGYMDSKADLYDTLNARVVGELYFDKERISDGSNPLLREDVHALLKQAKSDYSRILHYYFDRFYSKRTATLTIPNQPLSIYDMYLTKFMLSLFDQIEVEQISFMRMPDYDNDPIANQKTFWDALLQRDYSLLNESVSRMQMVSRGAFNRNPHLKAIFTSGLDYIVFPSEKDSSLLEQSEVKSGTDLTLTNIVRQNRQLSMIPSYTYTISTSTVVPTIPLLDLNATYVFPLAFYDGTNKGGSVIEILVRDYLNHAMLDLNMIKRLCDDFTKWSRLEQFYFGPILILLLRVVIQEAY